MNLVEGQIYACTVEKVLEKGVIVKMSDDTTEFIHVSKLSDRFVRDIDTCAHVGDTWKVVAVRNAKLGKLELTHKTSDLKAHDVVPNAVDLRRPPKRKSFHGTSIVNKDEKERKQPTLDEMIAAADKVLADKKKSQEKERYQYRKRRK